MAEVRLRLLRRSAQLHMVKDGVPGDRAAVLALCCMTPVVCNRETAACTSKGSHMRWTLWPSTPPRGSGAMAQIRFYSQGGGPRASFHQSRSHRRNPNNRAQGPEMPLHMTRTRYYDILEVSKNATQAQIKTAYYKQSFRFHPDRNASNEAATLRFGQVTEAYHVLGSSSLRKKYDQGVLSSEDVRTAKKPTGNSESLSRKEGTSRTQASSSTLAKPMFDFDAFYQAHYGEQLARQKLWKERREHMEKIKQEKKKNETNKTVELCLILLMVPTLFLMLSFRK